MVARSRSGGGGLPTFGLARTGSLVSNVHFDELNVGQTLVGYLGRPQDLLKLSSFRVVDIVFHHRTPETAALRTHGFTGTEELGFNHNALLL